LSRFSAEIDALHKPLRDQVTSVLSNGALYPTQRYTGATTWQFPVLAKYRLLSGGWRPFLEAGPSFRMPNHDLAIYGATAGAGVETQWRAIHISPAIRYTRWAGGSQSYFQNVHRDEAALVIGLSLGGPRIR